MCPGPIPEIYHAHYSGQLIFKQDADRTDVCDDILLILKEGQELLLYFLLQKTVILSLEQQLYIRVFLYKGG